LQRAGEAADWSGRPPATIYGLSKNGKGPKIVKAE
jgi:hypothetical protein